jgi:arylsulfatase A-like enzyme
VPRPNVAIVMPDQLRADAVGVFDPGGAHTPNIDALAARGTRFTQAFSQHSVCGPSRASIFSGWYPHVAGHRTLDHLLKPWEPNLLRLFKDAGYHVAWAGMRGDTFAPGVTKESTSFAGFLERPRHRGWPSPPMPSPALEKANCWYSGQRLPRDGEEDFVDFDEATVRTAEQLLREGMPEPWLLFVALVFPHPPFAVEDPWFAAHDRAKVSPPVKADLSDKPAFMRAMRDAYRLDLLSDDDWVELKATYYGMTARVDDQLRRITEAVGRTGASDRTAWAFFTDHGEFLGDYGLVEKWPSGLNDCLVRNPFVLSVPKGSGNQVCDELVEMVDLLPTLASLCEVPLAHSHFGRDLLPLLDDPTPTSPHRHFAFSEGGHRNDEPHTLEDVSVPPYAAKAGLQQADPKVVGKAIALRSKEWTYVHRLYEGEELYDRTADPHETVNLSGRAEVDDLERTFRNEVGDWLMATADVVPWNADPRFPTE